MAARRALHTTRIAVLMCSSLLVPVGCDGGDPSRTPPAAPSGHAAASATAATPDRVARRPVRKKPVPCPSVRMRSWTKHGIATVGRGLKVYGSPPDVVVSRTGTATVAWTAWSGRPLSSNLVIRTADDPPATGDPQDPAHSPPVQVTFPEFNDYLGIDAADMQTLVFTSDRVGGGPVATSLMLSDRAPGAEWPSPPTKALHRTMTDDPQLAVNASGAAVVLWPPGVFGPGPNGMWASYRRTADAEWTSPQRVPATNAMYFDVDIDDAGRVLVAYDRIYDDQKGGVWAIRRTPAGEWRKRHRLSGPNTMLSIMAMSRGGAAVVSYRHVDGDLRVDGPPFTARMSAAGTWGSPVQQMKYLDWDAGMDAKGRALLTGWHGTDLLARWSRRDGRWRKPFVVAADVSKPGPVYVAVNRRGDALVVWGAKDGVEQLWARYQPTGQEWTKPVMVTEANSRPKWTGVTIGECGDTAVAWMTRNHREVQVRRLTPTP
jgi:hypothetical protein